MKATNDGGPAFPADYQLFSKGMTLRDYFAAAALQGLLADAHGNAWCDDTCSVNAYKLADAMLKARGGAK